MSNLFDDFMNKKCENDDLISKQHLINILESISECIVVLDCAGKVVFCNRSVYKTLSISQKNIKYFNDLFKNYEITDEISNKIMDLYVEYCNHDACIKNKLLKIKHIDTKEVKYIELNTNHLVYNDETINSIVTLKDVTETKLNEFKIYQQAKFINEVVDTIDVPIAVVNYPENTYKLINKKYKDLMEDMNKRSFSYGDLISHDVLESIPTKIRKDFKIEFDDIWREQKEKSFGPKFFKDKDGNKKAYKARVVSKKCGVDNTQKLHIHGIDFTEEVNNNRELEKINKLKDEFFTVVSHELRTPITIIYSSLQLIYDVYKGDITPNIDRALQRVNQNCIRLLKIVNNILDLSKAEAGFLKVNDSIFDVVNLTENIVSSVNFYAQSKAIDLVFDTNEEEHLVRLDRDKYERVLLNLLSNAIKFTPSNKRVSVNLYINKSEFTLVVKDEGIGIQKDKIDKVFDRFAQVNSSLTRRAEGTGIGLSLSKKLVQLMNGTIEVESEIGQGSQFSVKFKNKRISGNDRKNYVSTEECICNKINFEFSDVY